MSADPHIQPVDPARLRSGKWCHRAEKTIGQGDISASYSGDRIGMGKPLRKPFSWKGGLWVCVGGSYRGNEIVAKAYRLTHPQLFEGNPVTYAEKTADGDAARDDPNGFYHGMKVTCAGVDYVLAGPPISFVPGQCEQLDLF